MRVLNENFYQLQIFVGCHPVDIQTYKIKQLPVV